MVCLAIVGSSKAQKTPQVISVIKQLFNWYKPTGFTSGGAKGIDTFAEEEARKRLPDEAIYIFYPLKPEWTYYKKRNIKIAIKCDIMVCITDRKVDSFGGEWTLKYAKKIGKRTRLIRVN